MHWNPCMLADIEHSAIHNNRAGVSRFLRTTFVNRADWFLENYAYASRRQTKVYRTFVDPFLLH